MQPELLAVIHVSTACCVLQYYVRAQVNRSTSQQSPMQGQARRRFVPTPQFVQLRSILRLCAPSFNVTADIALQYHGITLPRACVRCVDVSQRPHYQLTYDYSKRACQAYLPLRVQRLMLMDVNFIIKYNGIVLAWYRTSTS